MGKLQLKVPGVACALDGPYPPGFAEHTLAGLEHVGPEHTLDAGYGRVLERAYERAGAARRSGGGSAEGSGGGQGVATPTGFEPV